MQPPSTELSTVAQMRADRRTILSRDPGRDELAASHTAMNSRGAARDDPLPCYVVGPSMLAPCSTAAFPATGHSYKNMWTTRVLTLYTVWCDMHMWFNHDYVDYIWTTCQTLWYMYELCMNYTHEPCEPIFICIDSTILIQYIWLNYMSDSLNAICWFNYIW